MSIIGIERQLTVGGSTPGKGKRSCVEFLRMLAQSFLAKPSVLNLPRYKAVGGLQCHCTGCFW